MFSPLALSVVPAWIMPLFRSVVSQTSSWLWGNMPSSTSTCYISPRRIRRDRLHPAFRFKLICSKVKYRRCSTITASVALKLGHSTGNAIPPLNSYRDGKKLETSSRRVYPGSSREETLYGSLTSTRQRRVVTISARNSVEKSYRQASQFLSFWGRGWEWHRPLLLPERLSRQKKYKQILTSLSFEHTLGGQMNLKSQVRKLGQLEDNQLVQKSIQRLSEQRCQQQISLHGPEQMIKRKGRIMI